MDRRPRPGVKITDNKRDKSACTGLKKLTRKKCLYKLKIRIIS